MKGITLRLAVRITLSVYHTEMLRLIYIERNRTQKRIFLCSFLLFTVNINWIFHEPIWKQFHFCFQPNVY